MKSIILVGSIVLTLGLVPACAKAVPEPEQAPTATVAATPEETVHDATAPAKESTSEYSDGMRIPVDGSSLESFDRSLETIKSKASADEYTTLTGALDYLLIYDLSAKRDRAKLANTLDGLTGEEIVGSVN